MIGCTGFSAGVKSCLRFAMCITLSASVGLRGQNGNMMRLDFRLRGFLRLARSRAKLDDRRGKFRIIRRQNIHIFSRRRELQARESAGA